MCWVAGDPHYTTFDQKKYDFMGDCHYTLCKNCWNPADDYEIQAKNSPCGASAGITCTEEVNVRVGSTSVLLLRGHSVLVNGEFVDAFPYVGDGLSVDKPSNLQTMVRMYNAPYNCLILNIT